MDWLFSVEAWIALATLTALEIVLGVDNIVFISILAGKLPADRQAAARRTGLLLAMLTRIALLFSLALIIRLTAPLFTVLGEELSGRDLILLAGGLFLIAKATYEIHDRLEGESGHSSARVRPSVGAVLVQIMLLDVVFSLDSVITAVGMVEEIPVMVTAVMLAASADRADALDVLLAGGADRNGRASGGATALMAAAFGGSAASVGALLAAGADPALKDDNGRTALMAAALNGHLAVVDVLVSRGVELDAEDNFGQTASLYAATNGHLAILDLLRSAGARRPADTSLVFAARQGHTVVVQALLAAGADVNARDPRGVTALIAAAATGRSETLAFLLANGADVNARDDEGRTALIEASINGQTAMVERLLDQGADLDARDKSGRSAWTYAALANHLAIVKLFQQIRARQ